MNKYAYTHLFIRNTYIRNPKYVLRLKYFTEVQEFGFNYAIPGEFVDEVYYRMYMLAGRDISGKKLRDVTVEVTDIRGNTTKSYNANTFIAPDRFLSIYFSQD